MAERPQEISLPVEETSKSGAEQNENDENSGANGAFVLVLSILTIDHTF